MREIITGMGFVYSLQFHPVGDWFCYAEKEQISGWKLFLSATENLWMKLVLFNNPDYIDTKVRIWKRYLKKLKN